MGQKTHPEMPGLVACRRRWAVGTDDFVFPGLLEILLRLAWLIVISVVYNLHHEEFYKCEGGTLLKLYYIGFLTILSIFILLCAIIALISMQGTIANIAPRKIIVKFIYVKLMISIPEFAWTIIGTYWSFFNSSNCKDFVVTTVRGAVISEWILCILVIIGFLIIFDPLGKQNNPKLKQSFIQLESDEKRQFLESAHLATKKLWEKRCKLLFCCTLCDEQSNGAFDEISKLFADFFQDVDLVPSDIAAGLILVAKQQKIEIQCKGDKSCQNHDIPSPASPPSWMTTPMMYHYMKYAMGCYGWPLYILDHFATGCCQLCSTCRCCSCCMGRNDNFIDDNCCLCNTSAIRKTTKISHDDFVYVSFHNKIYEIPFYVAIDREHHSVVVAIRGTMSLQDTITDLCSEDDRIEGHTDYRAHHGFLRAAEFILNELQTKQILHNAFKRAQGAQLVITGHSLGAGTAALLSMLLRSEYPDLICFAFSPPGLTMSKAASEYCQSFVCSVVLGYDVVPRYRLKAMQELKVKMLKCISKSKVPKCSILGGECLQCCFGCCIKCFVSSQVHDKSSLVQNLKKNDSQHSIEIAIQNTLLDKERCKITYTPMYLPGRIIHIQEKDQKSCFESPIYYTQWKTIEDFSEILVHDGMYSDHMPDAVLKSLKQLSERESASQENDSHHNGSPAINV